MHKSLDVLKYVHIITLILQCRSNWKKPFEDAKWCNSSFSGCTDCQPAFKLQHFWSFCDKFYILCSLIHLLHVWCPTTYMPAWLFTPIPLYIISLTSTHLDPTDQTNQWPAGLQTIHVHSRWLLSFCLSPLCWERIQRFYQLWGYLCSLQLCYTLKAWDKDPLMFSLARKAEYHQTKLKNWHWFERREVLVKAIIFTAFIQILIEDSAFLWFADGESLCPQLVSYRKYTRTLTREREQPLRRCFRWGGVL